MSIKSENSIRWAYLGDTDVLSEFVDVCLDLVNRFGRIVPKALVNGELVPSQIEEEVSTFFTTVNFLVVGGSILHTFVDLILSLGIDPVR